MLAKSIQRTAAVFAGAVRGEVPLLLRFVDRVEPLAAHVVERPDQLPANHEAELPHQIHGPTKLTQPIGQEADLIGIARGGQPSPEQDPGLGHSLFLFQPGRLVKHLGDRLATHLQARIIEHFRAQAAEKPLVGRRIDAYQPFVGQSPGPRSVPRVAHKPLQVGSRKLSAALQLALGDGIHGRANPVGGQRVGLIERRQDCGQLGGLGLNQSLPRPGRLTVANPLGSHGLKRLQQRRKIDTRLGLLAGQATCQETNDSRRR